MQDQNYSKSDFRCYGQSQTLAKKKDKLNREKRDIWSPSP